MPERDPHSEFEDEGIPDLQKGTPEQEWAVDPQRAPLPADHPTAVDDFGTTAAEQAEGEPLDQRVEREVPEDQAMFATQEEPAVPPAVQPADEILPDPDATDPSDDLDAVSADTGLGVGSDLDTEFQPDDDTPAEWPAQPEEPSGRVWEEPRPAGRLVAPNEGAHPDAEAAEVATEVGPDAGGYTAEESAMRVERNG
jgi:hypothetical protein